MTLYCFSINCNLFVLINVVNVSLIFFEHIFNIFTHTQHPFKPQNVTKKLAHKQSYINYYFKPTIYSSCYIDNKGNYSKMYHVDVAHELIENLLTREFSLSCNFNTKNLIKNMNFKLVNH